MRKLLFPLLLVACSSNPTTPAEGGSDDAGDPDSETGTIEGGTQCAADKSPKEDKCVLDEKYGVFVSLSFGAADGDGSRTKPLKTIQAGIDLAKSTKRNVYVCAEPYVEKLTLANGVHMYGDLDCANGWTPGNARAVDTSNDIPAVVGTGLSDPTRIEGFEIRAPSSLVTSSIAMVLFSSPGVRLANMILQAQDAADGKDGTDAVVLTDSGTAKNGVDSTGGIACNPNLFSCATGPGAAGGKNTCTGKGNFVPGAGGDGGAADLHIYQNGWTFSKAAANGAPQPGTMATSQGGLVNGSTPQIATVGKNGTSGIPGANIGVFDPMKLYVTADGTPGSDGDVGQGGGGGAGGQAVWGGSYANGTYGWGYVGGGGGAGGCPGLAATIGTGGHASVALVTFDSAIQIATTIIKTGKGGKGGKAGVASAALGGGTGGALKSTSQAGAAGAAGGSAGASGNGAGGPSIGIAFTKGMPMIDAASMIMPGAGGAGVAQRLIIDLLVIPASPDGASIQLFANGS